MILILSRTDDGSTNRIIDWLVYQKKEYIRLNGNRNNYKLLSIKPDEISVEIYGKKINLLRSSSFWYRRSAFSERTFNYTSKKDQLKHIFKEEIDQFFINSQLNNEFRVIFEYLYYLLEDHIPNKVGNYFHRDVNKLIILHEASKAGLQIPKSYIAHTKDDLLSLKDKKIITKALKDGVYYLKRKYEYFSYTEEIDFTNTVTERISNEFVPSLLQEKINKKYELRVFYLDKKLYPTVIFSQQHKSAAVDFRKSPENIRFLPYNLPEDIREKIGKLMEQLGHKIGAIDLIVDENDQYIFLEVNPGGQFSYYSDHCNYYLEKEIAQLLT
ncbi:grasp-with-spasm system ATP-grasp peptide maturase [uncultured Chryseobacterium sp.]|uniref:grasp-with-spasm system ATP-grasp peptide maturase n=1 Tax=uncultured Chryseobacterium sp. TaxID=259322 RepID=UPI0025E2D5E0|nr:grasp-with-spasm system ATP-grasp peptide maturase [uncultured Chryseobacterium sp.]